MKNVRLYAVSVMALGLVACSSNSKKQEVAAAPTPQEKAISQLAVDRDNYVKNVETKIQRYDQFAGTLAGQAATTPKPQGKKMENAAEDLRKMTTEMREELADVKSAAPANWLDERRDVDEAMQMADSQYAQAVQLAR